MSSPDINEEDREAVRSVINTPILSMGPWIGRFEDAIRKVTGSKYAIAVNSGTSALHLIVRSVGLDRGKVMLTSPFTFVSSANVAIYEGAIPVFADIDEKTYNISPETLDEALEEYSRKGLETEKLSL